MAGRGAGRCAADLLIVYTMSHPRQAPRHRIRCAGIVCASINKGGDKTSKQISINITQTVKGPAIYAGMICGKCNIKVKHWLAKIIGASQKYGLERVFMRPGLYDSKGRACGYVLQDVHPDDILEEVGGTWSNQYRSYVRVLSINDEVMIVEELCEEDVARRIRGMSELRED